MISKINPFFITAALASVSVSFYLYSLFRKKLNDKIPTEWKKIGKIKTLFVFPLKSGHFLEVDVAECSKVGLKTMKTSKNLQLRDRSFAVYGEKDLTIKNGTTIPSLVTIRISIHDENHITLDAPQMETLYVRIPYRRDDNKTFIKTELRDTMETIDCGDEAARWLSQKIKQADSGYRLGYYHANEPIWETRYSKKPYYYIFPDSISGLYSFLTSILLVNQASVNDLNDRAPVEDFPAVIFRPNIVVDGPEPYDEDNWKWIKIGEDVILKNIKNCTRCVSTTIDPDNGIRYPEREPLRTLSKYRLNKGPEKAPLMGIHLEVKKTGLIKIGDPILIA
ncbi:hypothetical protein HHI36_018395 [Cryptolaemus montrouzieri]|uniref:MOSC domain-containing protein n=1 Tax=Cryptolaemus montrouzieri TaxID=559131 RepID=A0ABD2P0Q2_9CUCU